MKCVRGHQVEVLYKHNKGSHEAIIFIHGILEGPRQFRKLAQIAYGEGYSIYMLLLPGHGKSSKEFATTYYMEWIRCVSKHITFLSKQYDQLILVGHSMGALIAICESAVRRERIKALFLMNPPLKIHLWPRVIKGAIKIKLGRVHQDEKYVLAEYHAMGVGIIRGKDFIGWIRRYSELLSIIRFTKKQIEKINVPMFLVFAAKDEFVSMKSYDSFKDCLGKIKVLYLRDSGHFCYHHSDLVTLEKAYTSFIKVQKE